MGTELQEILGIMQVNFLFLHLSERYPPKQYMCFAQYFLSESAWLDM